MTKQIKALSVAISTVAMVAFAQDAEIVKVRGRGTGADKVEALKDAYRDAIERAVGMYVDAEQAMENEELVEDKILTQSNAYIEKYEVVKEKKRPNGIVEILIDAEVKKSALTKKLSDIMPKRTFVLGDETQNLHSKMVTTEKRDVDATTLLQNVLNENLNPVKQIMKMDLADTKPKFWSARSGQGRTYYRFRFTVDRAKYYDEFLPPLMKVLDQIALKRPKDIRLGSIALYDNPDRRSPEEDKKEYLAGSWDRDGVDSTGRNSMGLSEYLDADGGVYVGDIGLSDAKGNKWCCSNMMGTAGATSAREDDRYEDQDHLAKGGFFRVLVITKMNASRSAVQAREYELPPECAAIVQKWQKEFIGTWSKETQTAYNIIFSDSDGEEVLSTPVLFNNKTLANVFFGEISHFSDAECWYVTPMIHCDAEAFERWIAFDISRDLLPNIKSVSVELAE